MQIPQVIKKSSWYQLLIKNSLMKAKIFHASTVDIIVFVF
jgi:hypothetical protein